MVASEVVEEDGHLVPLPQIAPLVSCNLVLARHGVVIAHILLVEWAMKNVAFEGPCEIHLVLQRHQQALIVEQLDHAPPLQVDHLEQ